MNLKEAKKKCALLLKRLNKIKAKYPNIEFNCNLANDAKKYMETYGQYLYLSVDIQCCESEEAHKMCSTCNCWKIAKANNLKI